MAALATVWAVASMVQLVCRVPGPNWIYTGGMFFQSHTCEIATHLLAISSGHNTQQRAQKSRPRPSPNLCLDSLDGNSAFIAVTGGV